MLKFASNPTKPLSAALKEMSLWIDITIALQKQAVYFLTHSSSKRSPLEKCIPSRSVAFSACRLKTYPREKSQTSNQSFAYSYTIKQI